MHPLERSARAFLPLHRRPSVREVGRLFLCKEYFQELTRVDAVDVLHSLRPDAPSIPNGP
jgi:hypothetical protein